MADNSAPLLLRARQKSRHIFKSDEGNIEGIAKTHEARPFYRSIDVQHAREKRWLIRDDSDGPPVEPREAYDQILREMLLNLEKIFIVGHRFNHIFDVVRQRGIRGHERIKRAVGSVDRIR